MEWNQIKDKTKKVGPLKNLLQCKIKIKNSKEAYKNVKVKKKRKWSLPEFPTYNEFEDKLTADQINHKQNKTWYLV